MTTARTMAFNFIVCGRAYMLYLRITGGESKGGPRIKAVDAAASYEDIAKAVKHTSPAKATKSARERPGPGRALPAPLQICKQATERTPQNSHDARSKVKDTATSQHLPRL